MTECKILLAFKYPEVIVCYILKVYIYESVKQYIREMIILTILNIQFFIFYDVFWWIEQYHTTVKLLCFM